MILDIQDIINSVSVPALIKDEFIKRGTFARLKNGDFQACVGGFSIVFPVEVDGSKWAFRCWHHTLDNDQARIKLLSAELKKAGLPYFIDFEYEDNGIVVNGVVYPTTRMKWINGRDIKDYICYNRNNRHKLFELASNFFAMTQDLHRLSIAHGDLQHENIIVNPYGNIYLIDYDSMYVPALSYMNSKNSTNGKEGYQHPARENCVYSNSTLDYFSEVIILTSILAIAYNPTLIDKYDMEDSDTMLFKKADFRSFGSSNIYSDLSSMGDIFVVFLNVLSSYLKKRDITKIDPLELAVNKANPTNAISIADYLKNAENDLLKAEKDATERKEKEEQAKKRQLELIAWRNACSKNTAVGYQIYLNEYPFGAYAEEARKKKSERKAAEAEAERQAAIKAEEDAWTDACRLNSAAGFSSFLRKYPDSKYKDAAKTRLKACQESEDWGRAKASNTITALDGFINNYPDSIHVVEAKTIISTIRAQLEEARAWKVAQDNNTIESYKTYLKRYPNGRYALTAKNRIDELKKNSGSGAVWGVLLVIILTIIGAIVFGYNNSIKTPPYTPQHGNPEMIHNPSGDASPTPSSNHSISSDEIASIKNSLDSRLPGMEQAKKEGLTPTGISGAQKQINKLKDANDPSWRSYQSRLDKLK